MQHLDGSRDDDASPANFAPQHQTSEQRRNSKSLFETHREAFLTTLFFASPLIATAITAAVEALSHRISPLAPDPRGTIIALFVNAALAALGSGAAGFLTLRSATSHGRVVRGFLGGGLGAYACLIVLYFALFPQ